jgi:uncharacterized protein (TIGR02996 family)
MKDLATWTGAIRAEAEDDTPRLACADWLEERGQTERAEFIRVQCRLARLEDPATDGVRGAAWAELVRRQAELLAAHGAEWKKEVPAWARKNCWFERGFIARLGCGSKTFADKGGGLVRKAPLTSASLSNADAEGLRLLAACPHLAALQEVTLHDCEMIGIGQLLSSPHAAGLRGLDFRALSGYAARFTDLAPLLESPRLSAITRLGLRYIGFGAEDIRRVCDLDSVRQLELLRITSFDTRDDAVRELVADPSFPNLRSLIIDSSYRMSDDALRTLASSPYLGGLRTLGLRNNRELTDEGILALAGSPHFPNLADIDLSLTGVSAGGVRALIESRHLPCLRRIDIVCAGDLATEFPIQRHPLPPGNVFGTLWVTDVRS